jgi:hypothetical protein
LFSDSISEPANRFSREKFHRKLFNAPITGRNMDQKIGEFDQEIGKINPKNFDWLSKIEEVNFVIATIESKSYSV